MTDHVMVLIDYLLEDTVNLVFLLLAIGCFVLVFMILMYCRVSPSLFFKVRRLGFDISAIDVYRLRRNGGNPRMLIKALMIANAAGCPVNFARLYRHAMRGGQVILVVETLISAREKNLVIDLDQICQADMRGEDLQNLLS